MEALLFVVGLGAVIWLGATALKSAAKAKGYYDADVVPGPHGSLRLRSTGGASRRTERGGDTEDWAAVLAVIEAQRDGGTGGNG